MIISPHVQRSPEWIQERLGLPTASGFHAIITPTGKLCEGKTRQTYMRTLLVEWLFGQPYDPMQSQWMQRGNALEDEARDWLSLKLDADIVTCGLVLRDDRRCGASPDGFVGSVPSKRHVELKVPNAVKHLGYILDGIDSEHRVQLMGQMWVCETEAVEFGSYNPDLRGFHATIERDDKFIASLGMAVGIFCDQLDTAKERLLTMGMKPRPPVVHESSPTDPYGGVALSDLIPTAPPAGFTMDELDATDFKGI